MILVAVIVVVLLVRFPRLGTPGERAQRRTPLLPRTAENKYVYLFFLGMLCYTASEQGVAN